MTLLCRGPLADMLLDAGFSTEHTRRVVRALVGIDVMPDVMGRRAMDDAIITCEQAIARRGGAITFVVRVVSRTRDGLEYKHLTHALTRSPNEARLVAAQMAACHADDPMPLSAEVITDSTLTVL